ncbi:hypothetical protein ACUTQ5_09445 [Serratia sp. NA_112.1]|uniref:hypothetical protein n=1 Tax=Serratia sp. NA_112.1 TaxID=3415665 RepID=UPI004046BAA7
MFSKKMNTGILTLAFFVSFPSIAGSVIQNLSACDSSFFKEMQNNKEINDLILNAVEQNVKNKENISIDTNKLHDNNLPLNKYISKYTNMNKYSEGLGEYYYWGFETSEPLDVVVKKVEKQVPLVKNGDLYIYNPMIKDVTNSQWSMNNNASSGTVPGKTIAEKLFIVEKTDSGTTFLLCSLQGVFSDADLKSIRTDLN